MIVILLNNEKIELLYNNDDNTNMTSFKEISELIKKNTRYINDKDLEVNKCKIEYMESFGISDSTKLNSFCEKLLEKSEEAKNKIVNDVILLLNKTFDDVFKNIRFSI